MKRMHIHVGVDDLNQSIAFYTALFGDEPEVTEHDYAKWMLEDPKLNFAISTGHTSASGIEHVGIQVESESELQNVRARLQQAEELSTFEESNTTCCYANSNKTWTVDPQNVIWETFHSMEQVKTYGTRPTFG